MYRILTLILQIIFIVVLVLAFGNSNDMFNHMPHPEKSHLHEGINSLPPPKPGWVDPFDILAESRTQDSLFVQSEVEIHVLKTQCKSYEVYLRRFVNLFLSAVDLKNDPITNPKIQDHPITNTVKLVKLEFTISEKDIATLQKFGQESNDQKIEFVSDIFTRIFSQKTPQDRNVFSFSDFVVWIQKAFARIIVSPEWTVLSSVLLLLFLTLWLIYFHSYRLALTIALLTIFFAGFGFTWIRMYEEKEIERYHAIEVNDLVPKHCTKQAQTMFWYEHMYYRMFGVDCLKFLKTRDVRPIVKISPTDVFSETLSSMVLTPAKNIGYAYGNFVSTFLGDLPWWLRPIALPFSFFIPLIFITILFVFLFNYRLSFSITGFHLLPSWGNTSHSQIGNGSKYIEECACRQDKNCQSSSQIPFVDNNTPLFFMNLTGLKKLSSGTLLDENEKSKNKVKGTPDEDGKALSDECEKMKELREFEEFIELMETEKLKQERMKGKDIHQEESSLRNRRDPQETIMLENNDLASSTTNETPSEKENGKVKST